MGKKMRVLPGHVIDRGNNRLVHPGETFSCDGAEAARLVRIRVAEEVVEEAKPAGRKTAQRSQAAPGNEGETAAPAVPTPEHGNEDK